MKLPEFGAVIVSPKPNLQALAPDLDFRFHSVGFF